MAVGDVTMPQMHVVKGVKIGSTEAYVRYPNRRDLVIFEFAEGSNVAGVFTQKHLFMSLKPILPKAILAI
ncbi:bifunctional ornithine acetyltransferase/N-acetylglutamate synthase domain protein [Acinetobacter baumannii IS-123]|nr:bifunctional ornithine acetyltransferase/N-acetylglutamate synthase domain protein [Acinetobacter baumannii IS-123]